MARMSEPGASRFNTASKHRAIVREVGVTRLAQYKGPLKNRKI